ncbi:hypothetical protein P170DRAFT_437730 [Aspergillus steynii IBT 23096]|uniref:Uncharacterized protein n=1 Tax=Aspergillus steynii IBT 23096 TaxID=1392250 RepID=A0A2I2G565_9EURO|nr:uncharacterized protein P170DRAFT_437730 [Aspergillus steynii IBT 23096]PLB48022.1 hypothetical protein P170DRAFT_437730 [Aspergillus steynii IBT 23096]
MAQEGNWACASSICLSPPPNVVACKGVRQGWLLVGLMISSGRALVRILLRTWFQG